MNRLARQRRAVATRQIVDARDAIRAYEMTALDLQREHARIHEAIDLMRTLTEEREREIATIEGEIARLPRW